MRTNFLAALTLVLCPFVPLAPAHCQRTGVDTRPENESEGGPETRPGKSSPAQAPSAPRLDRLIEDLRSPEPGPRWAAARELAILGPAATRSVPVVLELLGRTTETADLLPLLHVLRRVGPWHQERLADVAAVVNRMSLESDTTRHQVLRTRAALQVPGDTPIPTLRRLLMSSSVYTREAAARCLASRPVEAAALLPVMKQVLRRPRLNMRMSVQIHAGMHMTLRPEPAGFFHALSEAIYRACRGKDMPLRAWQWLSSDLDPTLRRAAVTAMGRSPGAAAGNLRFLLARLADSNANVLREAVVSLGRLGPAASEALPRLREVAAGKDRIAAKLAHTAIQEIVGPAASTTRPMSRPTTRKRSRPPRGGSR